MLWMLAATVVGCGTQEPAGPDAGVTDAGATDKPAAPKEKKGKGKRKKGKGKAPPVEKVGVKVYYLDQNAMDAGTEPVLVAVERQVGAKMPQKNAVWSMFQGPTPEEVERGLKLVASGAEGFEAFAVADRIATLKLRGGCDNAGDTTSVYDLIAATLKDFEDIDHVKVLDPSGTTSEPEGAGDSRPDCLQP